MKTLFFCQSPIVFSDHALIPSGTIMQLPDMALSALMLASMLLVVLHMHTMAYRACVGPKSTCLYILSLPPLACVSATLLGAASKLLLDRPESPNWLVAMAYTLMWTTRESGHVTRKWLELLKQCCAYYVFGIALGVIALEGLNMFKVN
jgi:hypothetical protein